MISQSLVDVYLHTFLRLCIFFVQIFVYVSLCITLIFSQWLLVLYGSRNIRYIMQSNRNGHSRYYHCTCIKIWEPRGDRKCRRAPEPWNLLQYLFTILSWWKFYYEKYPGVKLSPRIYCPICEYLMEEIHWFWPKVVESA